ncbi:MAG: Smr/MutS family protein [Kofleriaceae bacterium]|nr:Smr/MutS family protein [Kofleriaceae bacterium]
MSPKRPVLSEEDQALFAAAMDGTTPLAGRDRVPVRPARNQIATPAVLPPGIELLVEGDGQRYAARAPGVSRTQVAELRSGKIRVEEMLDLHGEPVDRGLDRLRAFLVQANRIGLRCVLVVHGKGTHSDHGAPLREAVVGELLGGCSGFVWAMATAVPSDGGEGATYVMLQGLRGGGR